MFSPLNDPSVSGSSIIHKYFVAKFTTLFLTLNQFWKNVEFATVATLLGESILGHMRQMIRKALCHIGELIFDPIPTTNIYN